MPPLLVSWLGSDDVYKKVLSLIEKHRSSAATSSTKSMLQTPPSPLLVHSSNKEIHDESKVGESSSCPISSVNRNSNNNDHHNHIEKVNSSLSDISYCLGDETVPAFKAPRRVRADSDHSWHNVRDQVKSIFAQASTSSSTSQEDNTTTTSNNSRIYNYNANNNNDVQQSTISIQNFKKITKELCGFPSFFNGPLYRRILHLYSNTNNNNQEEEDAFKNTSNDLITLSMVETFWLDEINPYDASDRFFRLIKQPNINYITRDDFLPFIEELLGYHPGLEFLLNHAEFQEKYAVTVITRIFYCVNTCHNGKITSRQLRKSDLLDAFHAVDEEDDINKITHYFSYEHFYVLYCRFWELDHDRDYRITREDLLKYGDHSLSHLIVDRIFEAADRPFGLPSSTSNATTNDQDNNDNATTTTNATNTTTTTAAAARDYLSYEDFIFFMLSEEDKANEISVRYWFHCIDVDGDQKLNIMEMRSFYAVQLNRMQCLGHEIVLFEDMLCQMMDIIKPANTQYFVVEDFLQTECAQVSGSLFDALFNLTKFLQFEQKDPFMERQKREDEFECDWDRFACIDYHRLALEEEAREEEAMEIDWVTVDDDDEDVDDFNGLASEAPF